jgi:hypothetical protein
MEMPMSTKTRVAAVLAATTVMLAIACASAADTKPAAFPVGSYQNEQNIVVFKPDGTFVGTTPKGEDWVKGTYTHSGNAATVVDTWEGEPLKGENCMGKVGKYTWAKTGKVLTFNVVEDPCQGRKHGTDKVAWTQIK